MHAALKMCIELDLAGKLLFIQPINLYHSNLTLWFFWNYKGELAENLTVLSKEEWIIPHYNIKEDEEENSKKKGKVGTTKHKREYTVAVS